MSTGRKKAKGGASGYLEGQMLVAMPGMSDARFARTLVYMCAHSADGALGIVVNKPATQIQFPDLLFVKTQECPCTRTGICAVPGICQAA